MLAARKLGLGSVPVIELGHLNAAQRKAYVLADNRLAEANDLTVGIMALVAQAEREAISRRTREALAVAKARGVSLGNPNGAAALKRAGRGGAPLRAAIAHNADAHARDLAPVIADIRAGGATTLRAIAGELNARGMLTRRGGRWHVSTVTNLLDRLGLREAPCGSPG